MMRRWRVFALVLVLCLLLSTSNILAEANIDTHFAPVQYSLPFTTEDVTLSFMSFDSWYSPASFADHLPVWEEIAKRTGIKIDFQVLPFSQSEAAVQTRLAAGVDLPDIIVIPPYSSPAGVTKYAEDGLLLCLDPYIESGLAPDIKHLFETYPELQAMMRTPDGKCYSVANQLKLVNDLSVNSILFREDWIDKLNIDSPKTIKDWEAVLRAFKSSDLNGNGKEDEIPLISSSIGALLFFGSGFGFEVAPHNYSDYFWYDDDNQVYSMLIDNRMFQTVSWLRDMYAEGLIYTQLENDWDSIWTLYAQNIVGVYTACMGDYMTRADGLLEGSNHVMIMPPWPSEDVESKIMMRKDTEWHFGITASCKHPELAVQWLNYVYCSEEGYTLKEYGIEGQTYVLDENNEKQYTDFILKNPDGLGPHDAIRTIGGAPSFLVFDHNDWFVKQFAGTKVLEWGFKFKDKQLPTLPVMIPTLEEYETAMNLQADIDTYWQEMLTKFVIGVEPMDKWDEYVSNMKALGIDDIVKAKQAQFDRYLSIVGQ